MGQSKQFQIKMKQREKRKARRNRLAAKGLKIEDHYYGKYYIKLGQA